MGQCIRFFFERKAMNLFTKFAPLVKAGAVVHLTLRAVGDNMQLEILPMCDAGKTGLAIPPRAFLATPEELDAEMPAVIETYVTAAVSLSDQIAVTKVVMEDAERTAKETASKTASTPKAAPSKPASKPAGGAGGKSRDMNDGMLDDDDETGGGGIGGSTDAASPVGGAASGESTGATPAGEANLFTL